MERTCWVLSAVVALGPALAASAQVAAPPWQGPGMDPAQGRIGLDVTVTDASGHAVTGLTAKDFTLLDDGHPFKLVSFEEPNGVSSVSEPPVSVVVAIDEADLSHDHAAEAVQDVERYLLRNSGVLSRVTTVYRVTTYGLFATQPSADGGTLRDQVDRTGRMRTVWRELPDESQVRQEGGQSFIPQDASGGLPRNVPPVIGMPIAMKALGAIAIEQRRKPGRKLLFWVGPGWRVDSHKSAKLFETIVEFSTRLREARVEISAANRWLPEREDQGMALLGSSILKEFVQGVKAPGDAEWGNLALQALAIRTGGEILTGLLVSAGASGSGAGDIAGLIDKHVEQASDFYRLSFDPPPTGLMDEYRGLHVTVSRPGLVAHTTAGYYNEPVFYDDLSPYFKRVTVAQIEQRLKRGGSDRELAAELAGMESLERVSNSRLAYWLNHAPGRRTRESLTVLADRSAFFEPPKDDLDPKQPPNGADEEIILQKAADYLVSEIPRLPNFYANRITTQYGEPVPREDQTWKAAQPDRRLHLERTTHARVFFEDHKEVVDHEAVKAEDSPNKEKLTTSGTFGPILLLAMKRASEPGSTMQWSHWEKGAAGPVAVFRFNVAPDLRGFEVGFCCMALDDSLTPYKRDTSFRGEVAIDPSTGHIVRLMVQARLEPRLPLQGSGIVVEYGPVT
ncbi:MAG TPA: VWA domain-containing protein, partial [Terracidiphilus sp.]|nr:VWA domain-containing protein [Terracidiphilus sp.]